MARLLWLLPDLSVLRKLDEWIGRRLRAIAWKQWKSGPARFAELRRRGVG
jgi:RNA-directed DNA polymerase